jgi:hypothetical protein
LGFDQDYIPIKLDYSDLVEKLSWANNNDEQVSQAMV